MVGFSNIGVEANDGVQVAVLVPKAFHMELFIGRLDKHINDDKIITTWITRLSGKLSRRPDDVEAKESLTQLCTLVLRRMQQWKESLQFKPSSYNRIPPFFYNVVDLVLSACVDVDSHSMFAQAYGFCLDEVKLTIDRREDVSGLQPGELAAMKFERIGIALLRYRLASILPT